MTSITLDRRFSSSPACIDCRFFCPDDYQDPANDRGRCILSPKQPVRVTYTNWCREFAIYPTTATEPSCP